MSPVAYTFKTFCDTSKDKLLCSLSDFHLYCMNEIESPEQKKAWENSIIFLQPAIRFLLLNHKESADYVIVFEYELPRERGRRPDVLLLIKSSIIVLEFKERYNLESSYIDQVSAYARDLKNYHEYSHDLKFIPILVMSSQKELDTISKDVQIISLDNFNNKVSQILTLEKSQSSLIDYKTWLDGDYAPLPSLIQAARTIFRNEPLPTIRRAESAGIPKTLEVLQSIAKRAKENNEHSLVLITGVPGSGKTLVGISFVYEISKHDDSSKEAVLLSGNGPLVEVLQYALQSRVFVQDVHGFLKSYGGNKSKSPIESIFIYDEAQRAWDKEKVMSSTRNHDKSEPEDFLEIGKKKPWSLMIGLIGEGQEIHVGEEGGVEQWNEAIVTSGISWNVYCPSKLKSIFKNASHLETSEHLNLSESLRSHLAEDLQEWINELLSGNHLASQSLIKNLYKQQFDIYLTRDLTKATNYLQSRYANEPEKRYGLLASSKDKSLKNFSVYNDYMSTIRVKKGPWYIDDKNSLFSSCQFKEVMTEFGCQGLELDFPILCWGDDFIWNGKEWEATTVTRGAKNSYTLRKNSYRVLLSRGRDGIILFVPPISKLDITYKLFMEMGIEIL